MRTGRQSTGSRVARQRYCIAKLCRRSGGTTTKCRRSSRSTDVALLRLLDGPTGKHPEYAHDYTAASPAELRCPVGQSATPTTTTTADADGQQPAQPTTGHVWPSQQNAPAEPPTFRFKPECNAQSAKHQSTKRPTNLTTRSATNGQSRSTATTTTPATTAT